MRGTRTVEDPKTGIRILISCPAQQRIGQKNVDEFLKVLREFLEILGVKGAYVSISGGGLEIGMWGGRYEYKPWRVQP